ncbi:hypothetical protein E2C01_102379 [Portunus trituberculatus]|uniref:Uncharacterized protein n=1 Tax=Portunus trituberculatus TaxID=210409 RepID=A0A5B7KD08_PORTR|nr:hypothetical protein [Portunus trituberculatus]
MKNGETREGSEREKEEGKVKEWEGKMEGGRKKEDSDMTIGANPQPCPLHHYSGSQSQLTLRHHPLITPRLQAMQEPIKH